MIARHVEWRRLVEFSSTMNRGYPALAVVWGRRCVGKSFLLESLVQQMGGFYYAAVRGSSGEALRELGERIATFQGAPAPLALQEGTPRSTRS